MQVVVITPPAGLAVDLKTVKQHLRLSLDGPGGDDWLVQAYIQAAIGHIDGPDGWLGRALGVQTLEARLERFETDYIALPYPPLLAVTSVKYDDADQVERTLSPAAYSLDTLGLVRVGSAAWPSAYCRRGSVRIRYTAGYATLPPAIRAAVLLLVGDLYANRETGVVGAVTADVRMSTTVENLLSPYRVWRL